MRLLLSAVLMLSLPAGAARAEVPLDGFFIAGEQCPALLSIRKGTNPGDARTEAGRAYELLAGNREKPSHYLIRVPGAEPERRWVDVGCGTRAAAADEPPAAPRPAGDRGGAPSRTPQYVLAISWQPGFCETRPAKTECITQREDRFDASHFSLHGLWPQPRKNVYCQVSAADVAKDKAGRWDALPEVTLESETRTELDKVMPATLSHLDRHEWTKHGTCYGETVQGYFAHSLRLMREINASSVAALFSASIGAKLTAAQIRRAFDEAFGPGAGSRVRVSCVTDPSNGRRLIGELTIGLAGRTGEDNRLADLILAAPPTADAGCPEGIVDAAGFQ